MSVTVHWVIKKLVLRLHFLAFVSSKSPHVEDLRKYTNLILDGDEGTAGQVNLPDNPPSELPDRLEFLVSYARLCWHEPPSEVWFLLQFLEEIIDLLRENETA